MVHSMHFLITFLLFFFLSFKTSAFPLFYHLQVVSLQLPAIEVISKLPTFDLDRKRPSINVLVICPTRELALQAAAEANKLLKYHPSIGVQAVIGGTRLTQEQRHMQANPCQVKFVMLAGKCECISVIAYWRCLC